MGVLLEQILIALDWTNLLFILIGTLLGILIGAIPGLTVIMAVALAVPITMYLPLGPSLGLLLGLYISGIYGGSISAILVNTPGTPAAAATMLDGYPLSKQGRAGKALKMALFSSFVGGMISIVFLVVIARYLSKVALLFGPAEKTALLFFALTIIGVLAGKSILKGLLAACLGLFLSCVGSDPLLAVPRFTFGLLDLEEGLGFIPTLIGLFAISEFIMQAENRLNIRNYKSVISSSFNRAENRLSGKEIRSSLKSIFRSGILGTFIGSLPGIGATVACFLGYGEAKRSSKEPEKFGEGSLEGVAAAEAANNAVSGATLIPLLSLSIPGDAVTAILYGALLIQGVQTGPLIFEHHMDAVYLIYITLILANIFMVAAALSLMPLFRRIADIPKHVIFPIVFVFCVVGSYAIRNNIVDVYIMLGVGLLGYILRKQGIPLAPLLIGFILGTPFEEAFRQTLAGSGNSLLVFVREPISLAFLILAVGSIVLTIIRNMRENKTIE